MTHHAPAAAHRTDQQIVDQTEELANFLLSWAFNHVRTTDVNMRDSDHPLAQRSWAAACRIQEMLTATDVTNAVAEVDGADAPAQVPGHVPLAPASEADTQVYKTLADNYHKDRTPPTITGVAIKYGGEVYSLPAPNRHHHVIRLIAAGNGIKGPDVQGFITDKGEFLNRREAMALAEVNGQLNRRPGPQHYQGPELYSEDLW